MSAILPFRPIDSDAFLTRYFTPYQICWIQAEDPFHAAKVRVFALAEKSVRIGWTFCDGFKNVRKRLRFKKRDYLFVSRDWPSALEYMNNIYEFAELLGLTRAVLNHGEDCIKVNSLDAHGQPTSLTEEVKIGYIKFQNGSRIIAFSSNPYAMAVYGGDVGLDEFAKHPNAKLLWQTAQARVTWNYDLAVWSSHDGEDTFFNELARQARAAAEGRDLSPKGPPDPSPIQDQNSTFENPGNTNSPWNLYFRVTMPDAVELGLLDLINHTNGSRLTPVEFLADCRARSGSEEIYQQSYLCNPAGAATASIVEWSAIERCRYDYSIDRVHLESADVLTRFGQFNPLAAAERENQIAAFLRASFPALFATESAPGSKIKNQNPKIQNLRLGFDVAASGQGDLACIYIDEAISNQLWLRALFTCRTEDWHFLKTVLFFFLRQLRSLKAAGDESGLGRQICWEASEHFGTGFDKVNFTAKKQHLGFSLMNQLSVAEKRFPRSEQDVAADYFALRKFYSGSRWLFSETPNSSNPASHCDIAWAGALSSFAHTQHHDTFGVAVLHDTGWFDGKDFHPFENPEYNEPAPPAEGQSFTLACAFCRHRPPHFKTVPARCQKCGSYIPKS